MSSPDGPTRPFTHPTTLGAADVPWSIVTPSLIIATLWAATIAVAIAAHPDPAVLIDVAISVAITATIAVATWVGTRSAKRHNAAGRRATQLLICDLSATLNRVDGRIVAIEERLAQDRLDMYEEIVRELTGGTPEPVRDARVVDIGRARVRRDN